MKLVKTVGIAALVGMAAAACSSPPPGDPSPETSSPMAQRFGAMVVPDAEQGGGGTGTGQLVAPEPLDGSEAVFSGFGSGERDSWQTFELAVPAESDTTVSLDWNSLGPSNLNVYLKTLDGTSDHDYANGTTEEPEVAGARLAAGRYMVAVKIKTGTPQTGFTVSVDMDPVQPPTAPNPPALAVPPAPPAAPMPPTSGLDFPGDAAPGHVRWGAAVGGNDDPVARHESLAGTQMGLRRTYFAWHHISSGYLMRTVRSDLAAGRLPWVSLKTPGWKAMASGSLDSEIDSMLRSLDSAGGPVWLTIHHEPENDGLSATDWRAMQIRVRQRMNAVGTRNIAFAPVLMSWTFDSRSGRNPADWWVDGIWDFAGVDHYVEKESVTLGGQDDRLWNFTYEYYSDKGLSIALGEWANRGTDAAAAADMQSFYDFAVASGNGPGAQVIGLAYFDSGLNSPLGSYELTGQPLTRFRSLMGAAPSVGVFAH